MMRRYKIALLCTVAFSATILSSLSPALANISTSGDAGYNSSNIWAGNNAGSNGSISVSNGSSITTAGSGGIGNPSGNGSLNISSGGSVTINDPAGNGGGLQVGGQPNGTGSITVDGKGSSLNAKGNANSGYGTSIGYAGNGSLTIQNGGTGNFQNGLTIGGNAKGGSTNATDSSKGVVTVDGKGSTLNASTGGGYGNIIGDNTHGSATLNVENGGAANYSGTVDVGVNVGSTGAINVSGSGSTLTIKNGDADIGGGGNQGHGILNAKDGAAVSVSNDMYLGHNATNRGGLDGYGTADISGTNSTLNVGGDLMMAGQISTASQDPTGSSNPNRNTSTLTVENNAKTNVGGNLIVGYTGNGEVDIKSGGALSSNGLIVGAGWSSVGGNDIVNVDGKGSILSTKSTQIGNINGSQYDLGALNITNGANAFLGNTRIDKGILKITGATGDSNSLVIGNKTDSDGTVTVDGGSTLKIGDPSKSPSIAPDGSGNGQIDVGLNGNGVLNVNGNGSAVDANWVFVGNNNGSNGTVNITDGGTLNLTNGQLIAGYAAGSTGIINVDNGHLNANNELGIIGDSGKGTFNLSNNGTANFNQFQVGKNGDANVSSGGNLTVDKKQGDAGSPVLYVDNNGAKAGSLTIDGGSITTTNEVSGVPALAVGTGEGETLQAGGAVAEVNIKNGGTLTVNGSTQIAAETSGTMNIDGKGSAFHSWGNAGVWGGKNNYGTLNITNGGLWDQKDFGAGSLVVNGTINVSDSGSLANLNYLDLGNGDNGAVANIKNAGQINTDGLDVGDTVASTMNLSDNAVVNILSGDSIVGNKANGTLNIDKSSHFGNNTGDKTGNLIIANSQGTTGTVNVTNNSNLSLNQGNLTVGEAGTGLVNVSDSSLDISSGNLTVGDQGGSKGSMNNDGGSAWMTVGNLGNGTVNVDGAGSEANLNNGTLVVGNNKIPSFGTGTSYVNITNGGTLDANNAVIAAGGDADLTVNNGTANFKNGLIIGQNSNSNGLVTVSNGATLNASNGLTTGDAGNGTLTIDGKNNVNLTNNDFKIANQSGSNGTFNLENGAIWTAKDIAAGAGHSQLNVDKSTLNVGGNVTLAKGGTGDISLTNAALNFTGSGEQTEDLGVSLQDANSSISVADKSGKTTISGIISGAKGLLRKTGLGELILGNDNTYNGGTEIDAGTLTGHVNSDTGSFGSGNISDNSGATLQITQNKDGDFKNTLSGAGDMLINAKGGTIALSGDESQHTGKTTINQGGATLSSATNYGGGFDIAAGGKLSGLGANGTATIKGDLNNNGQLIVGSGDAKQTGTLNVDGNLFLHGGSNTTFAESTATDVSKVGLSNAVAGNDLINVAGNLSLGDANGSAIINVNSALANNADLGDGAYRLINYDGSLTDDGAKLGSVAVDPYHTAVLETGVDKEVNLLITDKTVTGTGTIWNGGNVTDATKNQVGDKVVGGDGTWSNANKYGTPDSPASISWSQPDNNGNMTYGNSWADGKTAIFQGAGGTVTISDKIGDQTSQVKAAGLSFNADGYTLKGDSLSDDGNGILISVGDGKSDGAKYIANIDNQLLTNGIIKQDLGTLNLNSDGNIAKTGVDIRGGTMNLNGKDNQFGGTSVVEAGGLLNANGKASLGSSDLRINDGGQADVALQSISDTATITDNGRLDIGGTQNNAKDVQNESGTLRNTLSGGGVLNKFGTGNIAITGNNSGFTGQAQINNGTLDFNGGNMSNSAVLVDAGGVADGDVVQKSATLTAENGASAKSLTLADATTLKDGSQTSNNLVAAGLKVTDSATVGAGDSVTLNKAQSGSSLDVGGDLDVAVNGGNASSVTLNDGSSLKAGGNIALGNSTLNATNASLSTAKNLVMGGDLTQSGKDTKTTANLSNASLDVGGSIALNNGDLTADKASKLKSGASTIVGSGKSNEATLNVKGGSSLSANGLIIGSNGAKGTLNLSDAGSSLTVANQTVIGTSGGTGTLNISGKGNSFSSNNIYLGVDKGSSGALTLADGTTLNTQGALTHGDGSASMSLTNASLNATGDLYDNVDTSLSGQNSINTDSHNVYLDSKLTGAGGFDKNGSGVLQINNKDNNYSGATNINQGILQGIGTIGGDLNMANGTTLRAGISSDPSVQYGKMQVNGNTVMESGSTMEANLGLYPAASGLNDSGSFTIADGTTLKTSVAEGAQLKVNQAYDIVHADGGVNGKFSSYQQDGKIGSDASDGYSVLKGDFGHPDYDKDDVKITLTFNKDKGLSWDGDRNQHGTGGALSPSVDGNTPLSPIANTLAGNTNEQRLHNLTQLDGEIASDMRTGNINSNFWIRDSVNNRLDCLEDTFRQIGNGKATTSNVCGVTGKKINVWGNMYGSVGGQNGHSGWNYANKVRDNNAGFIWGVDGEIGSDGYAEDRWHIGMMMGYGSVMESARGVSSSGESNNANIGMYFGKQVRFDNQNFFTFHSQFGYTWNIMSWHRSLDFQGATSAYNQSLHANELGGTAHINAEIAYKHVFNLWGTPLEVAPTGSITYLNYEQGSYHEHGGNLGLHGAATNTNLGYGFMGAKLATNFNIGDWVISPHGKFGYRRSFGANQSYTNAGFSALGSGTDMSIVGVPVVQDQALTELGFDVHPTDFFSFGANYVGLYGGHGSTMSGGQLSAKIAF